VDVSNEITNPLYNKIIPDFLSGHLRNLGKLFHLFGLWSMLPLIVLWTIGGLRLRRLFRAEGV
jgi:hypothetical protein